MRNLERLIIILVGLAFVFLGFKICCWQEVLCGLGLFAVVSIDSMEDGK